MGWKDPCFPKKRAGRLAGTGLIYPADVTGADKIIIDILRKGI
jgi:hypothetical protein